MLKDVYNGINENKMSLRFLKIKKKKKKDFMSKNSFDKELRLGNKQGREVSTRLVRKFLRHLDFILNTLT